MTAASFTIRRKVLVLFGAQFHIYSDQGALLGYCRQKAFKLKEDIRIYTDESMQVEKLVIQARSIIDWSASYDVVLADGQERLGTLQRKGMASLFRDSWQVTGPDGEAVGGILEDTGMLSFVRRISDFGNLIPQKFRLRGSAGGDLASFRTHFNPFIHRMTVEIDPECDVNPWLVLAAGVLLMAVEGRQN